MRCCGGLERIDDGRLLVALLVLLDRVTTKKLAKRSPGAAERGIDRRDLALPFRRLADRGFERGAVAFGHDREDRAPSIAAPSPLSTGWNRPREQRRSAHDLALPVDGGDRHRRVLEEAHEAHFGGALRVGAVVARAVDHERARGTGRAVGAEGDLVEQPRRQRCGRRGS